MIDLTVVAAQLVKSQRGDTWMMAIDVAEDGAPPVRTALLVPADAHEWRTAEFGLDDLDEEEVWSLVIRENFAPVSPADPMSLANAPTPEEARGRYLEQIEAKCGKGKVKRAAKAKRTKAMVAGPSMEVLAESGADDPLAVVCGHRPRRAEHVDARREIVRRTLEETRAERRASRRVDSDQVVLREAERLRKRRDG